MGLSILRNQPADLTGSYNNVGKETINALKKASEDLTITKPEIDDIEKAAKADGKYSEGEQLLVNKLREADKSKEDIKDFNFNKKGSASANMDLFQENEVNLKIKGNDAYIENNSDTKQIQKDIQDFKKAISYCEEFAKLSPDKKDLILNTLTRLQNEKTSDYKSVIGKMQIPSEVKELLANSVETSGLKRVSDFSKSFSRHSPEEQGKAFEIMKLLSENPPAAEYKKNIKNIIDSMPVEKGIELGKTLNKMGVFIPATNPKSPTAEDATARLQRVYMGNYGSPEANDYIRDMIEVGKKEGFKVIIETDSKTKPEDLKKDLIKDFAQEGYSPKEAEELIKNYTQILVTPSGGYTWAEDNKWFTNEGKIKTVSDMTRSELNLAMSKTLLFSKGLKELDLTEGFHSAGLSNNDPENVVNENSAQGAVADWGVKKNAIELGKILNREVQSTKTYNEGGNMVSGTLPNGEPYAVIGRDGLLMSLFHLENKKDPLLSKENVAKKLESMEKQKAFTDQKEISNTIQKLEETGDIRPKASNVEKLKKAKEFIAKMEIVKNQFAEDIGVPGKNITFIPQPEFHIDMFMRPIAPGKMLLNDFNQNIKIIDKALSKLPPGDSWQKKELEGMKENAVKMKNVMQPVVEKIAEELEKSGVKVIRSPGVMINEDSNRRVNFMNAIPGTTEGTNKQFYITNYTSIKPLRDAFEEQIKDQGFDKVYWTGDTGGNGKEFSGSETSLTYEGGLDCRENRD